MDPHRFPRRARAQQRFLNQILSVFDVARHQVAGSQRQIAARLGREAVNLVSTVASPTRSMRTSLVLSSPHPVSVPPARRD